MSLSVVDIVAFVVAGLAALSRVLTAAKPLWDLLPRPVAVALPVVVAAIPQILSAAGVVKTEVDLVTFVVMAVALLVPGISEAGNKA